MRLARVPTQPLDALLDGHAGGRRGRSRFAGLLTLAFLLGLALALLGAPLAVEAQPAGEVSRIGRIFTGSCESPIFAAYHRALVEGLRVEGWIEGRNVAIEYRCAEGHLDRLPKLAAELVQLGVDVLIAVDTPAIRAARQASATIPIVFFSGDPVAAGFVASLAKPGGNLTGVSVPVELGAKRLQLLKEAVPATARVGVLSRERGDAGSLASGLGDAAAALGVTLQVFRGAQLPEIERAFAAMAQQRVEALYVAAAPAYWSHRRQIADLAAAHRLPATYPARDFVEVGGLMSYNPSFLHMMERVGVQAGKVLSGADPATLPVERPTKFELVINLRAARALGLTIPPAVLARADEVIE